VSGRSSGSGGRTAGLPGLDIRLAVPREPAAYPVLAVQFTRSTGRGRARKSGRGWCCIGTGTVIWGSRAADSAEEGCAHLRVMIAARTDQIAWKIGGA